MAAKDTHLPPDVMMDIFTKLPVKSILRFRCVSKSWLSAINDPFFITAHHQRSSSSSSSMEEDSRKSDNSSHSNPLLLLNYRSLFNFQEHYSIRCGKTCIEHRRLDFPFPENFRIVDSCEGLICLLRVGAEVFSREIVLWNPVIRKFKTLLDTRDSDVFRNLHCDIAVGFGFVPQISDFKVVQLVYNVENRPAFRTLICVEVYTLGSDAWRSIEADTSCFPTHVFPKAFVNGAVHWMAVKKSVAGTRRDLILAFDLYAELFQEIALPKCDLGYSDPYLSVAAWAGSLYLFLQYRDIAVEHWEMWHMKEYGVADTWTKLCIIGGPEILFPLGFLSGGQVIIVTKSKQVVLFDPVMQRGKDANLYGMLDIYRVVPYMETLYLLTEGRGTLL